MDTIRRERRLCPCACSVIHVTEQCSTCFSRCAGVVSLRKFAVDFCELLVVVIVANLGQITKNLVQLIYQLTIGIMHNPFFLSGRRFLRH